MNEKAKNRSKDQTIHQLSSRHNRNFISGRIVSTIRSNDQNKHFSAQELVTIESVLRDDMQNNPWLLNLCKAITDESVIVTKEELEKYNKHKNEGQDVSISQSKVDQLCEELEFLKERTNILRYILTNLIKKLKLFQKIESNCGPNEKSCDNWLQMKVKLNESLEILKNDLSYDMSVEEPQSLVDCISTKVNDFLLEIDSNQSPEDWLDRQLNDLALTEDNKIQVLESINRQFFLKLEVIHKSLNDLLKQCLRIKEYYDINVKEEMSWRTDIYSLINHLEDLTKDSKTILSAENESNDFVAKKLLINEYTKIFGRVEKQELDEMQALIDQLSKRIDILSEN